MQNWILTDDDSCQHVRKSNDSTFEVIDIYENGDGRYAVLFGQVVLDVPNLDAPAFFDEYIKPYGYSSMAEVQEIYGEAASQIVAECVFETDPFSFGAIVCEGTFEECSAYITAFVREDGR